MNTRKSDATVIADAKRLLANLGEEGEQRRIHVISDWNTSVLRYTKPGKWLSGPGCPALCLAQGGFVGVRIDLHTMNRDP